MAKKNLHSLMSGIIGTDNSPVENPQNASAPQLENQTNSKRGPGRPKKSIVDDETHATFVVSAELLRKLKYISLMEDRLQKEVVNEALSLYVAKWEEENCKIKMPKK